VVLVTLVILLVTRVKVETVLVVLLVIVVVRFAMEDVTTLVMTAKDV
jgi:hypothetical protein